MAIGRNAVILSVLLSVFLLAHASSLRGPQREDEPSSSTAVPIDLESRDPKQGSAAETIAVDLRPIRASKPLPSFAYKYAIDRRPIRVSEQLRSFAYKYAIDRRPIRVSKPLRSFADKIAVDRRQIRPSKPLTAVADLDLSRQIAHSFRLPDLRLRGPHNVRSGGASGHVSMSSVEIPFGEDMLTNFKEEDDKKRKRRMRKRAKAESDSDSDSDDEELKEMRHSKKMRKMKLTKKKKEDDGGFISSISKFLNGF